MAFSCKKENPPTDNPGGAPVLEDSAGSDPAIVFLGDSLTAGFGLDLSESVPSLVAEKIKASGLHYRVINAGRSGDTTADGLERLSWYLRPGVKAKIFVIGLGSNDAMRGLSLQSMEHNLREMIRRIRRANPSADIYLFEMKTFPSMGPRYAGAYEGLFAKVAKAEKIHLLPFPLRGVAAVPRLNQEDGIHPNREGALIVAENVWRDLKPHL